jgi:hypothetical protein
LSKGELTDSDLFEINDLYADLAQAQVTASDEVVK